MSYPRLAPHRRVLAAAAVLALLMTTTSCRAIRAQKLEQRLDELENRVTKLEAQAEVRRSSD
ncbi:MAG: hypothetical protein AAF726_22525 [Planctomycetota bacterium]